MSKSYWHLKECAVLESLSAAELRRLEACARTKSFTAGAPIYLPADAADGVLLLVSGRVRICCTSPDGKRAILAYIDPGELFGELALIGGQTREEFAEAKDRSQVLLLPRDAVQRIMQDNPRLAIGITKLVGLRRLRIERRLKSMLFRSVRQRLADLLLELSERYGRATDTGVEISLRLSHQELACAIGAARESVTLICGDWTLMRAIENRRSRIVLLDRNILAAESEGTAAKLARPGQVAGHSQR